MKKLYSLVAVMAISTATFAQGTENFDGQNVTAGTSYTTVNFSGADNTTWALAAARIVNTSANYNIVNASALLSSNGTVTITFPNGVGNLKFQYRKAFTGSSARSVQVSVNGTLVNETPKFGGTSGGSATIYDYSYDINSTGSTTVEVKAVSAQITVDNFVWTNPTLAAIDPTAVKKSFIKNTIVENNLFFAAKSDVQIINTNGQVVKSASVNDGTSLDLSGLAKGMYIVTGTVNGEKVSQKIIKK